MFVAATFAFVLLHFAPGDAYSSIGGGMTDEIRATLRAQRGYDLPLARQYVRWLLALASGDWGWSTSQQRWVSDVIAEAIPRTLVLMSLALCASLALGMGIGAWQGARAERHVAARDTADRAVSVVTLFVYSMPQFWLALALMFCGVRWFGLPSGGAVDDLHDRLSAADRLVDRLRHLLLPWLSLTLAGAALFTRFQRSAMRDAIREPFVRAARAKGSRERDIRFQAWRTALSPVITIAGLFFPALLGGAVFVEIVYAWPGIGSAVLKGVDYRDYDLVAAVVVIGSAMTAAGSFLADLTRELVDPRNRLEHS